MQLQPVSIGHLNKGLVSFALLIILASCPFSLDVCCDIPYFILSLNVDLLYQENIYFLCHFPLW